MYAEPSFCTPLARPLLSYNTIPRSCDAPDLKDLSPMAESERKDEDSKSSASSSDDDFAVLLDDVPNGIIISFEKADDIE